MNDAAPTKEPVKTASGAAPGAQPGGPGGRGQSRNPGKRPRRKSQYGTQLQEKQDLKETFGIREEQLRKYYREAKRAGGQTGDILITILERRLDNAIFRAGFAQTRKQARQMTSHKFFQVNGRSTDIPSYLLRPGDVVTVREGKQKSQYFTNFEKRVQNARVPSWVELTPEAFSFKVTSLPTAEEANLGIDIRAIVEFFAR
ncbi:MAG: 30S ribosomal protein S4 [Candidatus Andersenbacteria bacterium]